MDEYRVTREDILKFPFPYKLWVIVNLPAADFLCWTFDGDGIIIYNKKLQSYLQSQQSIFVIKTSGHFVQHLIDFQFKSEELDPTSEVVLYFHHPYFKRKRLDLVSKIRRTSFFNLQDAQGAELEAATTMKSLEKSASSGKEADLCCIKFGVMSKTKMSSIQASTLVAFTRETKILQEKLKINEELVKKNSNKRGRSACLARLRSVDIPDNIYVNPYESTLAGSKAISGNGYAGFYGNYSGEHLKSFFGNYLPQYDENGILIKGKTHACNVEKDSILDKSKDLSGIAQSSPIEFNVTQALKIRREQLDRCAPEVKGTENVTSQTNESIANKTDGAPSNAESEQILTFALSNGSINANVEVRFPNDDLKMGSATVMDQVLQDSAPSQVIHDNQEFYDDLRATFELLQNQDT